VTVALAHVPEQLPAPVEAEVDVHVGHRHAVGVEEALEEELVSQRIDVRDPERVGRDGARGGTAPRPDGDLLPARPVDEIPDDQEVGGEVHPLDHLELALEALQHRRGGIRVAAPDPLVAELAEVLHPALAVGGAVLGDPVDLLPLLVLEVELERALLGDLDGAPERVGELLEGGGHLLLRLEVEFAGGEPHPLRVVERLPRLYAEEHVVGEGVVAPHVVDVVGGQQRQPEAARDPGEFAINPRLLLDAVVVDLEVEVPGGEDVAELPGGALRPGGVAPEDPGGDLPLQAGARPDQAAAHRGEQLLVDARLVVEPLEVGARGEREEVPVPVEVLGEEEEMERRVLAPRRLPLEAAPGGDIHLLADDRLHPPRHRLAVELQGPAHETVVGEGEGGHPQGARTFDEVGEAAGPVEEAVLAVHVQVGELCVLHRSLG